jgi:predicted esterase
MVPDNSRNVSQSVQWKGDSFRQALQVMQPSDTSAQHLPGFSIENSGSGSITFNINTNSDLGSLGSTGVTSFAGADAGPAGAGAGASADAGAAGAGATDGAVNGKVLPQLDTSIKAFEQDLHTFEDDLATLQKMVASLQAPDASQTIPPDQGNDATAPPLAVPPSLPGGTDNSTPTAPVSNDTPTSPPSGIDNSTPTAPVRNNTPTALPGGMDNSTPTVPVSNDTPTPPPNGMDNSKPPQSGIDNTASRGIDTTAPPNPIGDTTTPVTDKSIAPSDVPKPPMPTGPVNPGDWTQQTINGMKYDVLLPANYDPSQKYPTVLYLHQLDMGTDEKDLLDEVNPWFNSTQYRTDNPSIVVMPLLDQSADPSGQTVNFGGVSGDDQPGEDNAIAALKQVESQYSVDTSRVYVTGNSLGGIGTWDMLTKYNAVNGTNEKIFAAGMPLAGNDYAAGGGNPDPHVVAQLSDVPIWAIHGADDDQVPNSWDRSLAQSLANDPNFHYTELPTGHDVWDQTYPDQSYWTWLFSQQSPA